MAKNDYTIPYWLVGAILLSCFLQFIESWWGIVASTLTLFIVGWGSYSSWSRWRKLKHPFSIYKCGISSHPFPSDTDFKEQRAMNYFKEETIVQSSHIDIKGKGKHVLCIELNPKTSLEIDYINLRFLPVGDENRPKVVDFNETYNLTFKESVDDIGLGKTGKYDNYVNVHGGQIYSS